MKRLVRIFILIIAVLVLVVPYAIFSFTYVSPQEEVFLSLGKYEIVEYCSEGSWQDFTKYYELTYEKSNIENNKYLKQMTNTDIEEFNLYLDNFEEWVALVTDETYGGNKQFLETYDFDREIISTKDYCFINVYGEPDSYDLYFYDTETEILYYFHNNT